ncbi:MAG: ribosome small subunit-dependent GTPase A, partial [Alistipes sp.]|nr:ribosome small subunit-dependent GTPase A [Alistipes sp.]
EQADFEATYQNAGYEVIRLTATQGCGLERLRERLTGRISLLSGNSGVGKSTLIGTIDPTLVLRTGEVSQSNERGRHTTTFSEMYPLADGGFLIDTPGIKGFGLIDIDPREVSGYFPDLARHAAQCGYYNCTHTHEPHCAVRDAVEQGLIAPSRYESYLKLLDDDPKYRR